MQKGDPRGVNRDRVVQHQILVCKLLYKCRT